MYHLPVKKELILKTECHNPSHAYILIGDISSTDEFLKKFISELQVKSVDVIKIIPDASIKIEQIRNLIRAISFTPHSSRYKIAIIPEAGKLTQDAANTLLKTLEEPPKNSIIILIAENYEGLLPTVISRCRIIKIPKNNLPNISDENYAVFETISGLSVREKFDLADKISKNNKLDNFFNDWLRYLEKDLLKGKTNKKLIRIIFEAQIFIKKNINKRLMLENIFLET